MSAKPEQHLKVGEWWYLPQQDKLVKLDDNGEVCQTATLDNLCQKALNYFLVNAGRLVTRDELLSDVWGVRDVSDGRISRVIRVLRVALGDDSREPKYIETIPKRGFRFIAPIAEVLQADEDIQPAIVAAIETTDMDGKQPKRHSLAWFGLASLLILSLVVGWYSWQQQTTPQVPFARFEPLSSMDGLELYPDASPDGRYLVFSHSVDIASRWNIVVQDLQTLQKKVVKTVAGSGISAIWAGNGSELYYQILTQEKTCEVRKLVLDKTTFNALSDKPVVGCSEKSVLGRMSISPDNHYLVYPDWRDASGNMALQLLPLSGGRPEQLTNPPQNSLGDYAARFSHDGRQLAFLRDAAGSAGQIWVIDLTTRASRMLLPLDESYPGHISWNQEDTELLFPSNTNEISAVNVQSQKTRLLAYVDLNPYEINYLAPGKIIASVGRFWQSSLRKFNNPLVNKEYLNEPLEFASRNEGIVELNPDQDGPIAIQSNRSGSQQIWFYYPDGRQQQLSKFRGHFWPRGMEFSPDGTKLVAVVAGKIWLLQENQEPLLVSEEHQQSRMPGWGADSKTVFYHTSVNGRSRLVRYDLATQNTEFMDDKLDFYRESPDNRYFVRSFSDQAHYELVDRSTGSSRPLNFLKKRGFIQPRIALRSSAIYFNKQTESGLCEIFSYNIISGQTQSTGINNKVCNRTFVVTLDEKFIYQDDGNTGDLDIALLKLGADDAGD